MINHPNGVKQVESYGEIPHHIIGAKSVYLDFETTSGDPSKTSLYPWRDCRVLGVGIAVDDVPGAYYIPAEVGPTVVARFVVSLLDAASNWINHHLAYDLAVLHNECLHLGVGAYVPPSTLALVDTLTLAKLIDSDRYSHSLENLSKDWLGDDISRFKEVFAPYVGPQQKDYGQVPVDLMSEYGGQDVITNRNLFKYLQANMPEACRGVARTEIELTKELFKMQCVGLKVCNQELLVSELLTTTSLVKIHDSLLDITGTSLRPHTNSDCHEILCGRYGLPVLRWTKKKQPSFDKFALKDYSSHPDTTPEIAEVVRLLAKYRKLHTTLGLFIKPYRELAVNDTLYPAYNQAVRTGRLSCAKPNMQQLDSTAKALIHPRDGCKFIEFDFKSIEYRILAQYLGNETVLNAYRDDPDADYHQVIADLVGIDRHAAKSLNFASAYGAGIKKLITMLSANERIIDAAKLESGGHAGKRDRIIEKKARQTYHDYHDMLPELRPFSKLVEYKCKVNGYTQDHYGRRRHIPPDFAFTALNAVIQGSAAGLAKDRTVSLGKHLDTVGSDVNLVAVVHDSFLIECPLDFDATGDIVNLLEDPDNQWDVPIRVDMKECKESWNE